MDWKTMLRYISGSVDEELLLRNEYLVAENRVLRNQIQVCSARSRSGVDCQGKRICCCSQPATSYLSPSARCAPVNGLAGCYVGACAIYCW